MADYSPPSLQKTINYNFSNFPNLYVRKKQSPERKNPRIYSNENSNPGKMTKIDPNTNPKIKK